MTPGALEPRLRQLGLSDLEVSGKVRLFTMASRALARVAASTAVSAWWLPGRLEVFGTHTDYAGGRTLVAAVPRGFAFVAAPRTDGRVRVVDAVAGEEVVLDPSASPEVWRGWRRYAATVAGRLHRNFPGADIGADIALASDLPRAGGVSSSSAMVVGLGTVLSTLGGLPAREDWQQALGGPFDEAGYFACMENGLAYGPLGGDGGVGVHGGSEDHAAIVHGVAGHLSEWAFLPVRHLADVPLPDRWTFVVAESGVAAAKAGEARERYNRLSAGARALLRLANDEEGTAESLAAALGREGALEALRARLRTASVDGWTAAALDDRLTHFVNEDARVAAATAAFGAADAATVAGLAAASQREALEQLGNQTPETSALVQAALTTGALAARNFGAGFGGSAWALVERVAVEGFAGRWLDAYRRAGYAHLAAAAFEARPAPARTRLF